VYALMLAAAADLLVSLVKRSAAPRFATALVALPFLALLVMDWRPRAGWTEIERLHEAYLDTARAVLRELPEDARLGAWRGWHHAVYLDRPVVGLRARARARGDAGRDRGGAREVRRRPRAPDAARAAGVRAARRARLRGLRREPERRRDVGLVRLR
jgi:hypothetical protein